MVRSRVQLGDIEAAIDARLSSPGLRLAEIAEALGVSPRTIQRAVSPPGFVVVLNARRHLAAARLLVRGATVSDTAAAVGISPGHLATVFQDAYDLSPGELRLAVVRDETIRGWRKRGLPEPGTRWYATQRRRWIAYSRSIHELARRARPGTDIAAWLSAAATRSVRPDHRRAPYIQGVREQRRAARAQRDADFDAVFRTFFGPLGPDEVAASANEATQLRDTRRRRESVRE